MENIRVVKLNPNTYISNVITFDEAFDEYSEASGKRKLKKAEKQRAKAELQRAKGEKKVARVEKRKARKVARQQMKDEVADMRQARKTAKSESRQARRTGRAEAIQSRRTGRKSARLERRAMGEEFEPEIDETTQGTEYDTTVNDVNDTNGQQYGDEQYGDEQYGDEQYGDEQYGGMDYAPDKGEWGEQPDYNEDDTDSNDYNDSNYYENNDDINDSNDDVQYGDDYDSYQSEDFDPTANGFDGTISNDEEFFDREQASQIIDIPEAITVVADKIEWNKELYSRLDGKKKEMLNANPSANIDFLDKQMIDRGDRIADLEDMLDGWADCRYNYNDDNEFEEFPKMDIDYSSADGIDKINKIKRKRYKQVKKAKDNAKKKREKITVVKTTLNPIIERGRIVVPSSSNFEGIPQGTGLTGLDDSNDFDAPPVIDIELSSNAEGPSSNKININGVILGVGLAIVGIWAIRKYKLIK